MTNGDIEVGPNAVLAFRREGYKFSDFNISEFTQSIRFKGFRNFIFNHKWMVFNEMSSSISKRIFLRRLKKIIPELTYGDITKGPAGVRAQAMNMDGSLINDFLIYKDQDSLHLVNAPSPGATASLAIGDHIVSQLSFNDVPVQVEEPIGSLD